MMKNIFSCLVVLIIFSCNSNNIPDVSNVKIPLETKRFDQAFFSLDTSNVAPQLDKLLSSYPSFGENFMGTILGADPRWSADSTALYVKSILAYNKNVYDTAQKYFSNFSSYEKEIKQGLQFVKYYFPTYKVPTKIITYIGPADGYGDILDEDAFIVGLQAHLGKDFPLYKTDMVREVYPEYITARFAPDYIAVNCLRNIVNDMYPEKNDDKRLIVQMVEKGKRLWLLSKFLPETEEYKLMGYTKEQMKDCDAHQSNIWSLFIQNNFLQTADNNLIKNYVSEGPKTQELGEDAPGNIGSYAGWQIVKKYVSKNKDVKPSAIMEMDSEKLYVEAKYKP
jgi:hypothetical protein